MMMILLASSHYKFASANYARAKHQRCERTVHLSSLCALEAKNLIPPDECNSFIWEAAVETVLCKDVGTAVSDFPLVGRP